MHLMIGRYCGSKNCKQSAYNYNNCKKSGKTSFKYDNEPGPLIWERCFLFDA